MHMYLCLTEKEGIQDGVCLSSCMPRRQHQPSGRNSRGVYMHTDLLPTVYLLT